MALFGVPRLPTLKMYLTLPTLSETPDYISYHQIWTRNPWMRLAFLLSLLSVLSVPAAAQVDGSIRGTVLAEDGAPVANAHVYADVMQGSKILTVLNENTDDLGIFTFSRLGVGEYRVSADKQEAGYLSTRPDIFISQPALTIVLTPDTTTAN